jgi:hypothetical protein
MVILNSERRRTRAIKRGGQHPEWDEEIRFTLLEDDGEAVNLEMPPPPPPKHGKYAKTIKGGKNMLLSCWADDSRDPDLIGEATVDLTEVLTKGETDGRSPSDCTLLQGLTLSYTEWFTLTNKDKYCGEVYLELTFWSNVRASSLYLTHFYLTKLHSLLPGKASGEESICYSGQGD